MQVRTSQPGPRPPVDAALKKEVREAFESVSPDYHYSGSTRDQSRDTGAEVEFVSGSGGCFGPSEHYWKVKQPGRQEAQETALKTEILSRPNGASVNSDGTFVVGQFYVDLKEGASARNLERARDNGVVDAA
ncbi:MAG: hypothetical protein AB1758_19420, partial [Candidatus Eremiobacterota bacterium]